MNYKIEGSGETLVFIHGLSDNLLYWENLANNLKSDYQILRFDLRGHGETELGEDEITVDILTNDLKNLLDDLNIKKASLIGFSLGGLIAMNFAVMYPDTLSSLVLMSTFSRCDDYLINIFNQFKNALNNSFEEFYDLILPMVLCPDVIENNKEELELLKKISAPNADCQAYIKATEACSNFNIENQLSDINVPTLILAGKYDDLVLLSQQKSLHDNIKNSKLIVFENSKHNLLVGKNNDEILNILKDFLKKE